MFIKIVSCDDDDDDDDGGGGGSGVSITEVPGDTFYPLCSHIRYKKYWITLCIKLG
jgi:hypothetical protein